MGKTTDSPEMEKPLKEKNLLRKDVKVPNPEKVFSKPLKAEREALTAWPPSSRHNSSQGEELLGHGFNTGIVPLNRGDITDESACCDGVPSINESEQKKLSEIIFDIWSKEGSGTRTVNIDKRIKISRKTWRELLRILETIIKGGLPACDDVSYLTGLIIRLGHMDGHEHAQKIKSYRNLLMRKITGREDLNKSLSQSQEINILPPEVSSIYEIIIELNQKILLTDCRDVFDTLVKMKRTNPISRELMGTIIRIYYDLHARLYSTPRQIIVLNDRDIEFLCLGFQRWLWAYLSDNGKIPNLKDYFDEGRLKDVLGRLSYCVILPALDQDFNLNIWNWHIITKLVSNCLLVKQDYNRLVQHIDVLKSFVDIWGHTIHPLRRTLYRQALCGYSRGWM